MKKEDLLLQEELRLGNKQALESVYLEHRNAFVNFGKSFNLQEDSLLDIYQDATISLFQNFVMRQLVLESSSIKTYLFGIGKHLMINELKSRKKLYTDHQEHHEFEEIEIETVEQSIESKRLALGFELLGEKCKEILRLFYYRGLSVKEIVAVSHYNDENTVKSHKSRCMKQLKSQIKNDQG